MTTSVKPCEVGLLNVVRLFIRRREMHKITRKMSGGQLIDVRTNRSS